LSNVIKPIHTCCKNCVFSKYENTTQIGCELNFIEKYKTLGSEILEAYDEDLEFYVINNKKCLGYREDSYFKKRNMDKVDIKEKIDYFYKTNTINYLLVINLKYFNETSFDLLKNEIKNLPIGPKKVIFIRYSNQAPAFEYNVVQKFLQETSLGCEWRLQTMLSSDLNDTEILHNIINLNKKYRFVLNINELTDNIKDLVFQANDIVHNNLGHFHILSNKNKTNKIFSAASYRYSYAIYKENLLDNENNYITI
jgi:hypothetical protein